MESLSFRFKSRRVFRAVFIVCFEDKTNDIFMSRVSVWIQLVLLILVVGGCATGNSAIQTQHIASFHSDSDSLIMPFIAQQAGRVYRDPIPGVLIEEVIVDSGQIKPKKVIVEDSEIAVRDVEGADYLYLIEQRATEVFGEKGRRLVSASAFEKGNHRYVVHLIPIGTRFLKIVYRIRFPDGKLSPRASLEMRAAE